MGNICIKFKYLIKYYNIGGKKMRGKIGRVQIAHKAVIEKMEREIHHLQRQVNFLMEHHYTNEHHPLYGAWGVRGLDWISGIDI